MVSMCDPSIPLTTGEWEEWGNPNSAKYHDYMLSYSPMENIRPAAYPPLLVTAGLYDPRVAYWEPAKWVARLRKARTNSAPLLLKMDLETGHFSASDRRAVEEGRVGRRDAGVGGEGEAQETRNVSQERLTGQIQKRGTGRLSNQRTLDPRLNHSLVYPELTAGIR
jgi:hypothetical protein